ncbi:MAG: type II secretion system protein [Gallionella sp.]|nr:type II secretion system protein [Gallionella sp.]
MCNNIKTDRHTQTGFTLIEVLVVLIIVGMTSGVLFQALERAYQLQQRFGMELFNMQHVQMATDWYRQTVQGLHPDYPNGQHIFHGDDREFSGLTNNPLSDEYGAPTPFIWKLRDKPQDGITELVYIEEEREAIVLVLRGNQTRFIYFDEKQVSSDSWPPPLGLSTQLPKQIQLMVKDSIAPLNVVASPMGTSKRPARPQDFIGGPQ